MHLAVHGDLLADPKKGVTASLHRSHPVRQARIHRLRRLVVRTVASGAHLMQRCTKTCQGWTRTSRRQD